MILPESRYEIKDLAYSISYDYALTIMESIVGGFKSDGDLDITGYAYCCILLNPCLSDESI